MSTATTALVVSCVSVGLTLGGLIWQLTLYKLSGARLKVELLFFYLDEHHSIFQLQGSARAARGDTIDRDLPYSSLGIEAAEVRVTNVGRSPVSVDNIALDLARPHERRTRRTRYRRPRNTVGFIPLRSADARNPELNEPSGDRARLEPGEATSRITHLWPHLTAQVEKMGGDVSVRGTAHAVGRRRPKRSSRRFARKFRTGDDSWFLDYEVSPELRVFRAMWTQAYDRDFVGSLPLIVHWQISEKLSAGATAQDITAYLAEMQPDRVFGMAAHAAYAAYHNESMW